MDYGDTQRVDGFWWESEDARVGQAVTRMAESIVQQQRALREDTRFYMDLCSNSNTAGNDTYTMLANGQRWGWQRKMRQNICAAGVDTACSLIAQNRTAPIYLTSLGDFALSRKAEQRSRVIHSQFYDLNAYRIMPEVWRDSAETGVGHVFGCVRNGKPYIERCLPNEVLVEDMDGRYREPRSMYRIHFVAREQLRKLYKKHAEDLKRSGGPSNSDYVDFNLRSDSCVDRVRVVEAWHLPSADGANDGRHVVCTDNVTLVDEQWNRPRFPFVRVTCFERRIGYHGQGYAERLAGAQIQLNELNDTIRDIQRLVSNAVFWTDENDSLEWEDMTNLPGQVLKSRVPPQLLRFEGTPQDLFNERRVIVQDAFEQEGLSQQLVGGEKTPGLTSGRAVRADDDVRSRRHIDPTRRLEFAYMDLTQLISDLNDECANDNPEYEVTGRARFGRQTFLRTSKWRELELPDGDVRVNMFPMSALPTTVQGKFAAIEEWIQGGFVSRPQALDLMEFPDIDAWHQLENANLDLVRWQIERILDGQAELPIPNQLLPLAVDITTKALLVAVRMEAPDATLTAFTDYIAYAKKLMEDAQAADAAKAQQQMGPAALNQNAAAAAQMQLASQGAPPAGGMAA